ncbi:ogr/Delta-like zinc finger family protein [Desulfomicrobium salsuginis]
MALNRATLLLVAKAVEAARTGVAYSVKDKANCPVCGKRLQVTKTETWSGNTRTRFHKCTNPDCLLCTLGESVKSVEEI